MDRIKINLNELKSICTDNIDLDKSEMLLYTDMSKTYGYTDEEIETYLNGGGDDYNREQFISILNDETEMIVLLCGGKLI